MVACGALSAQSGQQSPYQGQSNPPADDAIVTSDAVPAAKPAPGKLMTQQPAAAPADSMQAAPAYQQQPAPQPSSVDPNANFSNTGTDAGTVALPPQSYAPAQPSLDTRSGYVDPDGDIVHPRPLQPGEIGEGTTIRVRLLGRLSTAETGRGETFQSRVASDVMEGGQIIIPAGTEIDGTVVEVSTGHVGGAGSMRLRPDAIVLADGTRYRLYAELSGTRGSNTHVAGEGVIKPDSRWKRNGIEYGGAVGAGVVTGAFLGGPIGAVAGGAIGAGAITAHLLISHPQAVLEPGTTLLFTLTEPLMMASTGVSGN
jgi:hypothetical protein